MHVDNSDLPRATGINLSAPMYALWDRVKAKVNRLLGNTPRPARATDESTSRLPHEILEMITAHLTRDLEALKACSLTCRSWYLAAVPHLHHTLTFRREMPHFNRRGRRRPPSTRHKLKPLSELHDMDLIPLVKKIRVEQPVKENLGVRPWLVPRAFSRRDLRHFSAFANVQVLVIQRLRLYRFIPGIERYFDQFSPTLRSLVLYTPRCTPRQLSHFFSLFPNLDDIGLDTALPPHTLNTTSPDSELVPFSSPKLRGRLTLHSRNWVGVWTDLIASGGGLRFRHMDLRWNANWASVLLDACAGTLETLRIGLREWYRSVGD